MSALDFSKYSPEIGEDGYCKAIHDLLFPGSTIDSIDIARLNLESRTYCSGSVFSRVRRIQEPQAVAFLHGHLRPADFLPPQSPNIGRFNDAGEKKLYLADHPYVALRECGILPGEFFLYSYFSFKNDMNFVDGNSITGDVGRILNELFRSKDEKFYGVINKVYKRYLEIHELSGVAYESARVPSGTTNEAWGMISSTTNLAIAGESILEADLVGGWLARCDENHKPALFKLFTPSLGQELNGELSDLIFNPENPSPFNDECGRIISRANELSINSKESAAKKQATLPPLMLIKHNKK